MLCVPELMASSRLRLSCLISARESGTGNGSTVNQPDSSACSAEHRWLGSLVRHELSSSKPTWHGVAGCAVVA